MFYNLKLLNKNEKQLLAGIITRYKGYDKMDMMIELLLTDPVGFLMRKQGKKIKKEEKIVNALPEALKFCDGVKCEITPQSLHGC